MFWLLRTSKSGRVLSPVFPLKLSIITLATTSLTSLSHVNQQIALKTIKKQGFSVSAVWNGQEALDYLLDAKKGSVPYPHVCLMDVQMPACSNLSSVFLHLL